MSLVDIGRRVDYEELERALIKAGEEVGWRVKVEHKFERNYRLGSVEETLDYDHTMVYLRGRLFPAMEIHLLDRNPTRSFFLRTGIPFGVASERRVKEYLDVVSRNLQTS